MLNQIVSLSNHPSLQWLHVFSPFLSPLSPLWSPLLLPQKILFVTSKLFVFNFRHLGQGKYRPGYMYWLTFPWPSLKVTAVALIKKMFVSKISHPSSLYKIMSLFSCILPDQTLQELFWKLVLSNFRCVFSRSKAIGQISVMITAFNRKPKGNALVMYLVDCMNLASDLIHDLDLTFFKI